MLIRSAADDAMGWLPLNVDQDAEWMAGASSSSSVFYSFSSPGSEVEIIDVRIHAYPND